MTRALLWAALLVALGAGCGDDDAASPTVRKGGQNPELPGGGATEAPASESAETPADEPAAPPDDAATIDRLGARPVWDLVVDRAQYLARRQQEGVAWGRLAIAAGTDPGGPRSAFLIDEVEGDGALVMRLALPEGGFADGARLAVRGAWELDEARRWRWRARSVERMPAAAAPAPFVLPPGHAIADADLPADVVAVGAAARGRTVAFYVVEPPLRPGDGWKIADAEAAAPQALLHLPGERDSYGGLDLRTADEHWVLARGERYLIAVSKVRAPRTAGNLPVLQISGAPQRVIEPGAITP